MSEAGVEAEDGAEAAFAALQTKIDTMASRMDRQSNLLTAILETLEDPPADCAPALSEVLACVRRVEARPFPRPEVTPALIRSEVQAASVAAEAAMGKALQPALLELNNARNTHRKEEEGFDSELWRIRRNYFALHGPLAVLFGVFAMAQVVCWYPAVTASLMPTSWRPAYAAALMGMKTDVRQLLEREAAEESASDAAERPANALAKLYEPTLASCLLQAKAQHKIIKCTVLIKPSNFSIPEHPDGNGKN